MRTVTFEPPFFKIFSINDLLYRSCNGISALVSMHFQICTDGIRSSLVQFHGPLLPLITADNTCTVLNNQHLDQSHTGLSWQY